MLKIKLARFGKRNQPHYRMVVNEARDKRDGSYVAKVGHYAPTQTPKILEIDVEAYQAWVKKGAQPTDTVAHLFERYQSGNPFHEKPKQPSKKARAKAQAEKEAQATPVEEVAQENKETEAPVADETTKAEPEATTETATEAKE